MNIHSQSTEGGKSMSRSEEKRRQTVLITGTTSGIGAAFAELFAENGYALALVSRSPQRLKAQQDDIESRFDVPVLTIACDLSDPWVPEEIVAELHRRRWSIDILVNNAGFNECGHFAETNLGHELKMIQMHVGTVTSLTKRLLPAMIKRGSGKILNVASTGGLAPCPRDAVYGATKAYVMHFSEALAAELYGSGIGVTTLLPGATRTAFAAKAGIADCLLFKTCVMDAARVAEIGYRATMKGKRRVIAGWHNRLLAALIPFTPRFIKDWIRKAIWCKVSRAVCPCKLAIGGDRS
jgi:short-subunit dehydrogenase